MSLRLAGIDHLSPSAAATLIECERKFWWKRARKLGRNERTEPLAMGSGLAHALEFGLDAGIMEYHKLRPQADAFTDMDTYEREAWVAEATIRNAYAGYVERYPAPPELQREVTYLVSLPGVDRVMQCRVDALMPGQYLVEDKLRSGSSMREQDLENERLQGDQLTAEIYAHWRATKGEELLPVRFRCTKKIDPRKVKPTKERPVLKREDIDEAMTKHFEGEVFYEWEVTRTVEQLEVFEREFADLAGNASFLLDPETSEVHGPLGRRNTKSCHMFGRTCPALAHCQGQVSETELLTQHGLADGPRATVEQQSGGAA